MAAVAVRRPLMNNTDSRVRPFADANRDCPHNP